MKREPQPPPPRERAGIRPWQILMLGVLAAAATAVVLTRDTGTVNMVFVAVAVATGGLVAAGAYLSLAPLVAADAGEQTEMLAGRTRAALDREKMLVLRSIKELEFDRAMGKISEADFLEMGSRLRSRAASLIRQIDGGGGYRALIERDLARMVGAPARQDAPGGEPAAMAIAPAVARGICPSCQVANDEDARFCKACGARMADAS